MQLPLTAQEEFIKRMEEFESMTERNDYAVAVGVQLAILYFSALFLLSANQVPAEVVNRIADQLEPLNKEGFVLLPSGTPPA